MLVLDFVSDLLGLDREQTRQSFITRQISVVGEATTITPLNNQQAIDGQDALAKGKTSFSLFFKKKFFYTMIIIILLFLVVLNTISVFFSSSVRKNVHLDLEEDQPHNLPGEASSLRWSFGHLRL